MKIKIYQIYISPSPASICPVKKYVTYYVDLSNQGLPAVKKKGKKILK